MRTAHPITTKLGRYIPHGFHLIKLWRISAKSFFSECLCEIFNPFSQVEHSICHILGIVGPIDVKQKGNESTRCYADYVTFDLDLWPWIFKVKLHLGNGRPDCHGTKGTGVKRMPWYETLWNWMLRWLGYLWLWSLTLDFQGQMLSREWEVRLSWNEGDGSR